MKYITAENLTEYAFLNEDTLVLPLRGICVDFHGYTDTTTFDKSPDTARELGEAGIAWVFPYYSPWAWMSASSREYNEQVLDAVYERLHADESIPLLVSGGSMGGMTALNYLIYGKRKAVACALNCPVTDVCRIFEDAPYMRRSILSAHILEEDALSAVLSRYSPVEFCDRLPHIPYFIVFGECDTYFMQTQMPPLEEKLKEHHIAHTLLIQPQMGHCNIEQFPDAQRAYNDFIISNLHFV
ncbi:MAG: hypothetical protein J6S76_04935 [Clostridia bacterium]|nr:hypothetical protein [Clostridia bacterium]